MTTPLSAEKVTQRQLVEKYRRGERITKADAEYSMFEAVDEKRREICRAHGHRPRVIVCWDSEADITECSNCGEQRETSCTFDEEMS